MRIRAGEFEPAWGHTIELRGVEVPLLSPRECQGDNAGCELRGARHVFTRLALRLRRWWRGEIDTDRAARQVACVVPPEFRPLVLTLSGHELITLHEVYHGLQARYYAQLRANARGDATLAPKPQETTAPPAPREHDGAMRFPIVPGRPLPGVLGGELWGRARREAMEREAEEKAVTGAGIPSDRGLEDGA